LQVLDYMAEGVKQFIGYTNKWKGRLQETSRQFQHTKEVPAAEVPAAIPDAAYSKVSKGRLADQSATAREHKPDLPAPPREERMRRIAFSKPIEEIQEVAEEILDDKDAPPSAVGEECFDRTLATIRRPKKKS
jgi:hypothetical protein